MNVVFIVPTGVGAEIGGHSGDATPAAKLIASVSDILIVHPNVVNASDINEMTENMLYVEGSILDGFLEGGYGLKPVYGNRILVAVNKATNEIVNAVSGARATIGADIEILELERPIKMVSTMHRGISSGDLFGIDEAVEQVSGYAFDVLVVNTPIHTDDSDVLDYLQKNGGVNLWGGVEAKLSSVMSEKLNRPVIHAPVENSAAFKNFNEIVDPRKAAEMVSVCYLHCCLKGAHKAPRKTSDPNSYWRRDIDFLVTPANVVGRPHRACMGFGIPIIAVKENQTILKNRMPDDFITVNNYLEAAGVISARSAGVSIESLRRPMSKTSITRKRR